MVPVVNAGADSPGSQAADGQQGPLGTDGANAKYRGRSRLPQMSRPYCINFQLSPIGSGYCPYQANGCPYAHELATGADVDIAQRVGDAIRARQARRTEQGQDGAGGGRKGDGKGRGRGGGNGRGWQGPNAWDQLRVEGAPFGSILAFNLAAPPNHGAPFSGPPHQLR